ncbi:DUF4910 domain-containing protein [Klebsiella aerogenes]|uniref:DUF4910 domain-containing protein n=1 Tax=Klebsiella aerogenes TaxID=548 RepID=UPI001BD01F72|nr:DUF4910 domain-containing protein [Klebsiella aerogenes]
MTQKWLKWALSNGNETEMFDIIHGLGEFDRYQASQGIMSAATFISRVAKEKGMCDATVHHFTANGSRSWWDFQAPVAWTPLKATLSLFPPSCVLDHRSKPFTLATYSAAACGQYPMVFFDEVNDLNGKVVLIPASDYQPAGLLASLKQRGAAGFVTDAFARFDPDSGRYWRGRLELPPGCELFAFSVLPEELRDLACAETEAYVEIVIDDDASMPVVSASIPGKTEVREIWVTAHLCHSRAGANDNASGVSASLEVAKLVQCLIKTSGALRYPIRFIWGPEFLGVAAMQYKRRHLPGPIAVINLDMVGEDPERCGAPMCVELPPDSLTSPLGEMAKMLMQNVFSLTAGYPGSWLSMPFHGFSDHALFMNHSDAQRNCPAVQLCHINDRFNHTAADLPDKVSGVEMKRAVAVALALIMQLQALRPEQILPHRQEPAPEDGGLVGRWEGPLNLRGLIQRLDKPLRQSIETLISRDKRYLALLHLCAIGANGCRRETLVHESANTIGLPLSDEVAALLFSLFDSSDYFQVCRANHIPGGENYGSTTAF